MARQTQVRRQAQKEGNMRANIFCNDCKKPLRSVKEWGRGVVDVYVIPCENCAAQLHMHGDSAASWEEQALYHLEKAAEIMQAQPTPPSA